jgi:hypothetical protein
MDTRLGRQPTARLAVLDEMGLVDAGSVGLKRRALNA